MYSVANVNEFEISHDFANLNLEEYSTEEWIINWQILLYSNICKTKVLWRGTNWKHTWKHLGCNLHISIWNAFELLTFFIWWIFFPELTSWFSICRENMFFCGLQRRVNEDVKIFKFITINCDPERIAGSFLKTD